MKKPASKNVSALGLAALVTLLVGIGTAFGEPAADAARVEHLLSEGHYREAYDAAAPGGQAEPETLEITARALLRLGMASDDSFLRWFSLRAARGLNDPELVAAARPLVDANDRYVQSLSLEFLAETDLAGNRDTFVRALDSPFRTVRIRALRALEKLRDPTLVTRLGTVLTNDPDADLRAMAARGLGATGSKQAIPILSLALDDSSPVVQEEAVRSLVALGDQRVVRTLKKRLAEAPPKERTKAVRLAALVPDASLIPSLGPLLGDGDPEVRAFTASAILSIRHRTAGQPE
jgi:HEAT repeat protein